MEIICDRLKFRHEHTTQELPFLTIFRRSDLNRLTSDRLHLVTFLTTRAGFVFPHVSGRALTARYPGLYWWCNLNLILVNYARGVRCWLWIPGTCLAPPGRRAPRHAKAACPAGPSGAPHRPLMAGGPATRVRPGRGRTGRHLNGVALPSSEKWVLPGARQGQAAPLGSPEFSSSPDRAVNGSPA